MLQIVVPRRMYSYTKNPVHHINIVVLESDNMSNPQSIRVLNTDVVDFSTDTVDVNDNSDQMEVSNNMLIIGMSNSERIAELGYFIYTTYRN